MDIHTAARKVIADRTVTGFQQWSAGFMNQLPKNGLGATLFLTGASTLAEGVERGFARLTGVTEAERDDVRARMAAVMNGHYAQLQ
jgi:hypothetical protein